MKGMRVKDEVDDSAAQRVMVDVGVGLPREVQLLSSVAVLRERARARLQKKGVAVPSALECLTPSWLSATFAVREPYTVCFLVVEYQNRALDVVGVAKRNPRDRRNFSVGVTLAVYRAWRDFWTQAAQLESRRVVACNPVLVDEPPYPAVAETLERVREAVAEVPF